MAKEIKAVPLPASLRPDSAVSTYLFSGSNGTLKTEWVLGFSKSLNCEQEKFFEDCGCVSCRKIERRVHPDVRWVGTDEKARSIKIEEVRTVLYEASRKPFEGKRKVFIFQDAERLTLEAANALLKTLEEPPGNSVFMLLAENKAHLLETIQSRSFEVRVPPPPEPDPGEDRGIRLLAEKGWEAFFEEASRTASRAQLGATLRNLLLYLRNKAAEEWEEKGAFYTGALEAVYKTLEALDSNVNQKLALTYLEIQWRRLLDPREKT